MQLRRNRSTRASVQGGLTLIEMMITVAILAILAGIAIPLYDGYITEGHFASMRTTIHSMRVPVEDFRLERGDYGGTANHVNDATKNEIGALYGWDPGADISAYTYTLAVVSTGNYHVWGTFTSGIWVRCEDRQSNCCDSDTPGATGPTAACP